MYCGPGHFHDMRLVFNVNLCGDLGESTFAEGCPREAKEMTCQAYVTRPENMREAYWIIRSLDVYRHIRPAPTTTIVPVAVPPTRSPFVFVADVPGQRPETPEGPGRPHQPAPAQPEAHPQQPPPP